MRIILILLALLTSTVYAQTDIDIKLFVDLNIYRVANRVTKIEFDTLLYQKGSEIQLINMVKSNRVYHSDVSEEIVMSSTSLPITAQKTTEFNTFLKDYYNISYDFNPTSKDQQRDDFMLYLTKYIIFVFHKSKHHRASMLSRYNKFGASALSIKAVVFQKGTREIIESMPVAWGEQVKFTENIKSNYKFKLFVCINFNDYKFR